VYTILVKSKPIGATKIALTALCSVKVVCVPRLSQANVEIESVSSNGTNLIKEENRSNAIVESESVWTNAVSEKLEMVRGRQFVHIVDLGHGGIGEISPGQ
jgi:hypothetical protein